MSELNEELSLLKQRADLMGIKYSNNIGIDTLKAKINEKLEASTLKSEEAQNRIAMRKKLQDEQLKLVRIKLQVMNPSKQAQRGEIFTVANSVVGTVKKFVPYNPKFYTNGYHVPYCIYTMLKDKTFLHIKTEDNRGRINVTTEFIPEFSIQVLPNLTPEELQELAIVQKSKERFDD